MAYKFNAAWKKMRENHLLTYPSCAVCDDPTSPHVHHLRYRGKRGTSEVPGDLVTLCRFYHRELHRTVGARPLVVGSLDYIRQKRFDLEHEITERTA